MSYTTSYRGLDPWLVEEFDRRDRTICAVGSGLFFLGLSLGVAIYSLPTASLWIYLVMAIVADFTFTWYINSCYLFLTTIDRLEIMERPGALLELLLCLPMIVVRGFLHVLDYPYNLIKRRGYISYERTDLFARRKYLRTDW